MISAQALGELMAMGFDGEKLLAIVTVFERDAERDAARNRPIETRSKGAIRAHNYRNRRRKGVVTDGVTNVTRDGVTDTPPSPDKEKSPPITPSKEINPSPPSSSLRSESINAGWPKDFREQFWAAYPRKVGKLAAIRKLEQVRRTTEVPWQTMMSAARAVHADDPKFIPHPTTWLSDGRFLDGTASTTGPPANAEPAYMTPPPGAQSRESILALYRKPNGQAGGTQVRSDAGVGENGADEPAELPLSSGGALHVQARRPSG